jgi:hypothetical protein
MPKITIYSRFCLAILVVAALLTLGCNNVSKSQAGKSTASQMAPLELTSGLLEAGVGIPEVKLGQTRAEAEQSLGTPTGHDRNEFVEGQTFLLFHDKGIELSLQDDKIEMITLHSKNEKWQAYTGATQEGVGITSTGQDVLAALGTADEDAPRALRYTTKGLVFRFDQNREGDGSNSRVESVSVIPPKAAE